MGEGHEGDESTLGFVGDGVTLVSGDGDDLAVIVVEDTSKGIKERALQLVDVTFLGGGAVLRGRGFDAFLADMRLGTLEPEYDRQRHGEGRVPVWWDAGEGSVLDVLSPGGYGLGGFDHASIAYMAFRALGCW